MTFENNDTTRNSGSIASHNIVINFHQKVLVVSNYLPLVYEFDSSKTRLMSAVFVYLNSFFVVS